MKALSSYVRAKKTLKEVREEGVELFSTLLELLCRESFTRLVPVKYGWQCHVIPTRRGRMSSLVHNFQIFGNVCFGGRGTSPQRSQTHLNKCKKNITIFQSSKWSDFKKMNKMLKIFKGYNPRPNNIPIFL